MNKRKIIAIVTLTSLIYTWSLSNFFRIPVINFPPKVKEAQAAAPTYVGGNSGTGTGATYAISLTALTGGSGTTAQTGDLVIVVTGWASTVNGDPGVDTAGYTEVADLYSGDTRDVNMSVNWKVMGGTPDTSVTVRGFNNAANGGATVVHVWRGVDQTTPMDATPTVTQANNQSAARPDAPSITPVTANAIVIATGIGSGDTTPTAFTTPSGMTNGVSTPGAGSTMSVISNIASFAWSANPYDPAAWTGGETTTSDSWAAATLALRPAVTTLGDGTDPTAAPTVAPSSTNNYLDQFTFQTTGVSDTVTALTVTTVNTSAIASMQIWNEAMSTQYFGTVSSPTGDNWSFSGGTAIPVTGSADAFRVVFTAKDHTLASGSYAVTGTVAASFTSGSSFNITGTDVDSDTVTVDNLSPNAATSTSGSAGNTAVTLNWTTSDSADFNTTSGSVIYRWTSGSAGSEVPAENSTPTVGTTNGTATVACVVSSSGSTGLSKTDGTGGSAECTTSALTNGQAYSYKVFQKDTNGNYDTGTLFTGSPFTPVAASATFTQNHYRWYVDSDNENVTDAWSSVAGIDLAEDTALIPMPVAYDPPSLSQELRLRMNVTVNTATITGNSKYFKLQYRTGTDSSCSTGSWTDVGPSATWEYASSTVTDDTTLTVSKLTGTDRLETYSKVKPANTPTGTSATGEDIEFDFHIIGTNSSGATRYLFRIVETTSDGTGTTTLNSYSGCPILHTEPQTDNILRHGNFFSGESEQGFFWGD